jgi:FkbM family methyltransferase
MKFHKSKFINDKLSLYLENFILFCKNKNLKFYYNKKDKDYYLVENNRKIFFSNKIRGFNLYREGIDKRAGFIFSSYCLHHIKFSKEDIFIDCGANYGDMMLELSKYIKFSNYYGIEPSPSSFKILKKNIQNKNSKLINKALGKKNSVLPFYISETEADSSIIKPKIFTEIINTPVITLENLINEYNIKEVGLLKIEAEGYEPEILEGLGNSIQICKYIAIDGGYERGVDKEQTFTTQTNYLIKNGFEIVDIFLPYCRALFVNKNF